MDFARSFLPRHEQRLESRKETTSYRDREPRIDNIGGTWPVLLRSCLAPLPGLPEFAYPKNAAASRFPAAFRQALAISCSLVPSPICFDFPRPSRSIAVRPLLGRVLRRSKSCGECYVR